LVREWIAIKALCLIHSPMSCFTIRGMTPKKLVLNSTLFSRRTRLRSIATMMAAPAIGDPPFRLHTSASSSSTTGEDEEPWSPIICDPPFAFINKNSRGTPTYVEHRVPKSQRSTRSFAAMKAPADSNHSSCPTTPSFSSILPDDDDAPFSPIICYCTFAFCIKDSRGNCSAAARHHATTRLAHRPTAPKHPNNNPNATVTHPLQHRTPVKPQQPIRSTQISKNTANQDRPFSPMPTTTTTKTTPSQLPLKPDSPSLLLPSPQQGNYPNKSPSTSPPSSGRSVKT